MGALRPWHLMLCLCVFVVLAGGATLIAVLATRSGRRGPGGPGPH
jgi:hypothetical protein